MTMNAGTWCTLSPDSRSRCRNRIQRAHSIAPECRSSFGEILVPTEEIVEMRNAARSGPASGKFFPGYVLVYMEDE